MNPQINALTNKIKSAKKVETRAKYMKQLAEVLKADGWYSEEILYWFNFIGFPLEVVKG